MLLIPNRDEGFDIDANSTDAATINALFDLMDLESERNLSDILIVSRIVVINELSRKINFSAWRAICR